MSQRHRSYDVFTDQCDTGNNSNYHETNYNNNSNNFYPQNNYWTSHRRPQNEWEKRKSKHPWISQNSSQKNYAPKRNLNRERTQKNLGRNPWFSQNDPSFSHNFFPQSHNTYVNPLFFQNNWSQPVIRTHQPPCYFQNHSRNQYFAIPQHNYPSKSLTNSSSVNQEQDSVKDEYRMIRRDTLVADPELNFNYEENLNAYQREENQPSSDSPAQDDHSEETTRWTDENWVKGDNNSSENESEFRWKQNKIHQHMPKAMTEPVKITKAESMMQKMGWKGGALGKTGEGIVEPIVPDATYAFSNSGLGHDPNSSKHKKNEVANKKAEKKRKKKIEMKSKIESKYEGRKARKAKKELFKTNTLRAILEFVRDDREYEVAFESTIPNYQRKMIHELVENINTCIKTEVDLIGYDNLEQMDILSELYELSDLILKTESVGEHPNRCLHLYKEETPPIFVVTNDDLYNDEVEQTDGEKEDVIDISDDGQNEASSETPEDKADDDTNIVDPTNDLSETEEVTMKLEKECKINEMRDTEYYVKKLTDFLWDFIEREEYTELRFLGRFEGNELDALNYFLENYMRLINECKDSEEVLNILTEKNLELQYTNENDGRRGIFKVDKKES